MTVTVHHVVCVHTYQEGQGRKPVGLGEEVNRLLSVELILHLQMLTMHAILSVVNELQHQIQSCRPVMTWDSLGLHVLAPEVVGSEKPCTFTTSLCHHAMYCI